MKKLSIILLIIVSWLMTGSFADAQVKQINTNKLNPSTGRSTPAKIIRKPNLVPWNAWVTIDNNNHYTCHANIKNISDTPTGQDSLMEVFFNGHGAQRFNVPPMGPNSVRNFDMPCSNIQSYAGKTIRAWIKVDSYNRIKESFENDNLKNFNVRVPKKLPPVNNMTATIGDSGKNLYIKVSMRENVTNFSDLRVIFMNRYAPLHHTEANNVFVFGPYPLSFTQVGNGLDTMAFALYKNRRVMRLRIKIEPKFSVILKGAMPINQ